MKKAKNLLGDILVLDLADEQGSFCSRLLADLGAKVIKVEEPEGSSERRIGPFYLPESGIGRLSLAFACHNAGKMGTVLDLQSRDGKNTFRKLVNKADVLVETFPLRRAEVLGLSPGLLHRINPRLIHLSITAFGRRGPGRNHAGSDSVGSASGGQLFLSGAPEGPPLKPFGPQSFYTASLFGAAAVLLNLRKRKTTGRGDTVDISIQEAVASTLDHVMVDYFQNKKIASRQGAGYGAGSFSILPCKDGYIQITIPGNWETLVEVMASDKKGGKLLRPEWQDAAYRENHFEYILETVAAWTRRYTRRRLFELGQAMRFPWAPVESPTGVLKSPQLRARNFFVRMPLPGGGPRVPLTGSPYRFSSIPRSVPKPAPLLDEHALQVMKSLEEDGRNRLPAFQCPEVPADFVPDTSILKGMRVVDLTRMLSGPYATRILADFGAEVIKVQPAETACGAEHNDTPYFETWNRNKRGICLNLNQAGAREKLLKLVAVSDVVVENYSPRVMSNWGLTYERLREAKPDIVVASLSAMGSTGPWRGYVGFAPTFHALSGMISLMPPSPGAPVNLGHAYSDVIAGLYAALGILAALEHRNNTGKGQLIDISQYEAMCTLLGPAYMESALKRSPKAGRLQGGLHNDAAPDGCYRCLGDDRWCVISIVNDEQWRTFCRITRYSAFQSRRFSTSAGRRKNRATLDRLIGQWASGRKAEAVASVLQEAGIAAAVVQNAEDLAKDPQLKARRFFTRLKNPAGETILMDRSALWPWKQPTKAWKAAPRLGQDNHEVFARLLRLPDTE